VAGLEMPVLVALASVCVAFPMTVLDLNIVYVALSSIGRGLPELVASPADISQLLSPQDHGKPQSAECWRSRIVQ
jgi:hypothetical protein